LISEESLAQRDDILSQHELCRQRYSGSQASVSFDYSLVDVEIATRPVSSDSGLLEISIQIVEESRAHGVAYRGGECRPPGWHAPVCDGDALESPSGPRFLEFCCE
jgi:hypothetical protein